MSILDLEDDGTIEWLIREDGYSLARARHEDGWRYRADVWTEDEHHAVPKFSKDNLGSEWIKEACTRLISDYDERPEFWPGGKRNPYARPRDPIGYPRAVALRDRMMELLPIEAPSG